MRHVGIHGIGVYLPEQVRKNDWWPASVVDRWRSRSQQTGPSMLKLIDSSGEGERASTGVATLMAALAEGADDPFQGARARRVAPDDMPASDMEARAAREAIARARVEPGEIDFLLTYSSCPDYIGVPNACAIHRALGLSTRCLSLATEGASNTFLLQLGIAEQLIASGRFHRGLLVQSSNMTRFMPADQPASALFGDGATAVVVGEVAAGKGVLGSAWRTDGANFSALVVGIPGRRWHDEGRPTFYVGDAQRAAHLLVSVADRSPEVIADALAQAGGTAAEVGFYACHQGAAWLRRVTQQLAGLSNSRSVDTFPWAASMSAANIPLVLSVAEREGSLRDGDLVVAFSGGSGETWASVVLRWGRS